MCRCAQGPKSDGDKTVAQVVGLSVCMCMCVCHAWLACSRQSAVQGKGLFAALSLPAAGGLRVK